MDWYKTIIKYFEINNREGILDKNFILYDDGKGVYIGFWESDIPQPTKKQLEQIWNQYKDEIEIIELKEKVIANNKDRLIKKYIEGELIKEGILDSDGKIKELKK